MDNFMNNNMIAVNKEERECRKKNIESQLNANAKALEWAHVYLKGQELKDFRSKMISNRIKLKRLLYANSVNPSAAIFGESQVGKSYMVDCLLTSEEEVLKVYDGYGMPTGFLASINPLGGGKEATSLITRFTMQQVWKNPEFPVKATMLSPMDVILVLLDAYYNDVSNHNFPKLDAVKEEIQRLNAIYSSKSHVQGIITEDDIYELKDYMSSNLVSKGEAFRVALMDSGYFESLALIIGQIDIDQWVDVFAYLWNQNAILTEVFKKLISTLRRIDFSREVFIKMDAVLRKYGTILHVDRMYELLDISEVVDDKGDKRNIEKASEPLMVVLTEKGNLLEGINKSDFCVLATELAFTIVNPNKNNENIVRNKPFLSNSDILDFPGARSRKSIYEGFISETDACEMLLRGKVAYLFNKYSQQYLISNLLFCHHDVKSEVVTLSSLLKGWVENTIGKTPEERAEFMKVAAISPLFVIGTKFNIDLTRNPDDSKGDAEDRQKAKDYRWSKRFDNLEKLIVPSVVNDWLTQWTPGRPFKNVYLLRSFEYSCQSGLFEGYQTQTQEGDEKIWKLVYKEDGRIQGETNVTEEYRTFIPALKESFLKNSFVERHFENPTKSWDEVASVAKDGSAWIIENLSKSSTTMFASREEQFSRVGKETFTILVDALQALYHSDNSDEELRKQVRTAGAIALSLDILFGKDKYFFSDFISSMIISEEDLHDVVIDIVNSLKVVNETDLSALFAIRAKAKIDNSLPFEENVSRLLIEYQCDNMDFLEKRLEKYGFTIEDVINPPKMLNFSKMVSEALGNRWIETHMGIDRYEDFIKRGLDETELKQLLNNMLVLYRDQLNVSDVIAKKLHPFVSAAISVDEMADMIADITAETINSFINSMGSSFFDEETWNNVESTIAQNKFDIQITPKMKGVWTFDADSIKEELPAVFDTFDNVDAILNEVPVDRNKLRHFSNYQEFYHWSELMKISFLATQDIPKYDVNMNNALRRVLLDTIVNQVALDELVNSSIFLQSLKPTMADEIN